MTKRALISAVLVLVVVGAGAKWAHEGRRLSRYCEAIEVRYPAAIALIEHGSRTLPPRADLSDAAWAKRGALMGEIERSLSAPEIVAAGWTVDGHHGSETLRPWNAPGYSTGPLYRGTGRTGRHSARYGETFDGKRLIVFHGIVPDGAKRHYWIAFFEDALSRQQ